MNHKHYLAAAISAALLLTGCQQTQTTELEQGTASTEINATETQVSEETLGSQTEETTFHPVTEVSTTTQAPAETSETTQVTAKPQIKTFSPDGSLSCESINQPENMSVFIMADRTADGFGCITYDYSNEKTYYQIYYHSFSEDLQTVKTSSLAIPELDGYSLASPTNYYLPVFDGTEIWAFVTLWSDNEIKTPEVTGETHTVSVPQSLLCHYGENGSLLSAIPVNEFENYSPNRIQNFVRSGGNLYMTMSDSTILQIDKETAKISVAADLGKENLPEGYNRKFLCFDRDDKPVVLQEKWYVAPDTSKIEETNIIDYDLESGSSGQTLYSTDEVLKEVTIVKGCGEYRFFINTHHELIGIKDDGSNEVLIDIDASELENQIMTPEDHPVPYTDNLFDINIIPVDDTQFLALYLHYPDYRTEAYCLTRNQ